MECMVYAKQRWGQITSKKYASSGGNYTAQDLYDNWTGDKGDSMPSSLPALALWESDTDAGHTGIVEKKDGSKYFYSDHNGIKGYGNGYGSMTDTAANIADRFDGFIGYCW